MTKSQIQELEYLLERAKKVTMTNDEVAEQRRSFAYGNSSFENPKITREIVEEEARKLGY
jgi:hypothetical protein